MLTIKIDKSLSEEYKQACENRIIGLMYYINSKIFDNYRVLINIGEASPYIHDSKYRFIKLQFNNYSIELLEGTGKDTIIGKYWVKASNENLLKYLL